MKPSPLFHENIYSSRLSQGVREKIIISHEHARSRHMPATQTEIFMSLIQVSFAQNIIGEKPVIHFNLLS